MDVQRLPRANIQYHIPDTFAQKQTTNRKAILSGPTNGTTTGQGAGTPTDMHRELSWNYHNKAIYSLWNHFVDVCLENQQQSHGMNGGTWGPGGGGGGGGSGSIPVQQTVQQSGTVYTAKQNTAWWQTQGGQHSVGVGVGSGLSFEHHHGGYGGSYGFGGSYDGVYDGGYVHYEGERMYYDERFYENTARVDHTTLLYNQSIVQNTGAYYEQNGGPIFEQNSETISSIVNTVSPRSSMTYRNRHIREAWRLPMFVQLGEPFIRLAHTRSL